MSSALVDQGGRPRGGAGSHEADVLRELQGPEIVADRLPRQPIGDASGQVVNRRLVAAALGRLTPEHRNVLRECCFRGSSVAQAAQALGITPGTVQSRIYYALRALRLALEELGGVE